MTILQDGGAREHLRGQLDALATDTGEDQLALHAQPRCAEPPAPARQTRERELDQPLGVAPIGGPVLGEPRLHPAHRQVIQGFRFAIGIAGRDLARGRRRTNRFAHQGGDLALGGGHLVREALGEPAARERERTRGRGALRVERLLQDSEQPRAHLPERPPRRAHAMREIAREHADSLVEDRDQKGLLGGEVPVEGLVGEPRLPEHLADPRLQIVVAPDQDEGGFEQPADLFGIGAPPLRERALDGAGRQRLRPGTAQNLVLHFQNGILRGA